MNLIDEFKRIKANHGTAIRQTAARAVLAPSVMRVYSPGTKEALFPILANLPVQEISAVRGERQYRAWFERHLDTLAREIERLNRGNDRVNPGYKWGHATKLLCLFVREATIYRRLFSDAVANRIESLMYVPIDSIVIKRLRQCGCKRPFGKIREIDTPEKFYEVQRILGDAAAAVGVPRLWFDDNWGDRRAVKR